MTWVTGIFAEYSKLYERFTLYIDQYKRKGAYTTISGYDTYTTYVDTKIPISSD